jgi:hypothetical protein
VIDVPLHTRQRVFYRRNVEPGKISLPGPSGCGISQASGNRGLAKLAAPRPHRSTMRPGLSEHGAGYPDKADRACGSSHTLKADRSCVSVRVWYVPTRTGSGLGSRRLPTL